MSQVSSGVLRRALARLFPPVPPVPKMEFTFDPKPDITALEVAIIFGGILRPVTSAEAIDSVDRAHGAQGVYVRRHFRRIER